MAPPTTGKNTDVEQKVDNMAESAKQTAKDAKNSAGNMVTEAKESLKDAKDNVQDKSMLDKARDKAHEIAPSLFDSSGKV